MVVKDRKYIVVGCHGWNKEVFDGVIRDYPGEWRYVDKNGDLQTDVIRTIDPTYIFFLHWSWKVPEEIVSEYECVCFHMTDLPYGRGGSPLQNLIVNGYKDTMLTAFRMNEEYDSGPIYMKEKVSLDGRAKDIYRRVSYTSAEMIKRIIHDNPQPDAQVGSPTYFKRRKPEQSIVQEVDSLDDLYDFIRMLDAEGYPRAFINYKNINIELSDAKMEKDSIVVSAIIKKMEKS
jgi:methionyl-tRNA formyltransferase